MVVIDKLIKIDFFYNSKDATPSTVHCNSTGGRPLALLPLLFDLFYLGPVFLISPLPLPIQ